MVWGAPASASFLLLGFIVLDERDRLCRFRISISAISPTLFIDFSF